MKLLNLLVALIFLSMVSTGCTIGTPTEDGGTNDEVVVGTATEGDGANDEVVAGTATEGDGANDEVVAETGLAANLLVGEVAEEEKPEEEEAEGSDDLADDEDLPKEEPPSNTQINVMVTEVLKAFVKAFLGFAGADGAGLDSTVVKALEELLNTLETASAATNEEPAIDDRDGPEITVVSNDSDGSTTDQLDYWTEERMRNAKPMPMGISVPISEGEENPEVIEDKF